MNRCATLQLVEAERDTVGDLVIDLIKGAAEFDVPFAVDVSRGDTWAAATG